MPWNHGFWYRPPLILPPSLPLGRRPLPPSPSNLLTPGLPDGLVRWAAAGPTTQVTNLGWSVDNVTANANICMQTVAPCDTPDALCQGVSCRYSIFNEAVRGV